MNTWTGVTIAGTPPRVTRLNLYNRGLKGSLPAGLNSLTGLERLILSYNQLTGSIQIADTDLSDLDDLQVLNLDNNNFTAGKIPEWVDDLTSLTQLYLASINRTGPIPGTLNGLTALTDLYLDNNQLSGPIPTLSALTALEDLNLSNNQLTSIRI